MKWEQIREKYPEQWVLFEDMMYQKLDVLRGTS